MKSFIALIQQILLFAFLVVVVSVFSWCLWNYPGETWAVVAVFFVLLMLWQVAGHVVKDMK